MKSQTRYLTFRTRRRRELVRITDEVSAFCAESGVEEGHDARLGDSLTAALVANDDEGGVHADIEDWLERLAPGRRPTTPPLDPIAVTTDRVRTTATPT